MEEELLYNGHYHIIGPPGTGKTTFLKKQVERIVEKLKRHIGNREPVLICSLTRTAAAEIAGRSLPIKKRQIATLHSHAFRSLDYPMIATQGHLISEFNKLYPYMTISSTSDDVERGAEDIVQSNAKNSGDAYLEQYETERHKCTPRDKWPAKLSKFAENWERYKSQHNCMDFTDLIEKCITMQIRPPGNPYVIIADEAQDLSRLEFKLLKQWGDMSNALIAVGDPWQAIYEWRGADPDALFNNDISEDRIRVLSTSYRISAKVHRAAMQWVKGMSNYHPIDYKPRDEPGFVSEVAGTFRRPESAIDEALRDLKKGKSVMFVASCGYQLDTLRNQLKSRNIPYANPWRTKRGDWNPLNVGNGVSMTQRIINLLRPDSNVHEPFSEDGVRVWWTPAEFKSWATVLQGKGVILRGMKKRIDAVVEKYPEDHRIDFLDAALYFEEGFFDPLMDALSQGNTAESLRIWSNALMPKWKERARYPLGLFKKNGPQLLKSSASWYEDPSNAAGKAVFIGTIHSFKGAEADVVYLIPDLSASAMREWIGTPQQRDGIYRAFYVAITRAKQGLRLMQPTGSACIDTRRILK